MDQEDQKDQQVQEDDEDTNDEDLLSVLLASVEGAGGEVLDQPDPLGDLHLDRGSPASQVQPDSPARCCAARCPPAPPR